MELTSIAIAQIYDYSYIFLVIDNLFNFLNKCDLRYHHIFIQVLQQDTEDQLTNTKYKKIRLIIVILTMKLGDGSNIVFAN